MECLCVVRGFSRGEVSPSARSVVDGGLSRVAWPVFDGKDGVCEKLADEGVLRVVFGEPRALSWAFPAGVAEEFDCPAVVVCRDLEAATVRARFAARHTTGLAFEVFEAQKGLPVGAALVYATVAEYSLYVRATVASGAFGGPTSDGVPPHVLLADCVDVQATPLARNVFASAVGARAPQLRREEACVGVERGAAFVSLGDDTEVRADGGSGVREGVIPGGGGVEPVRSFFRMMLASDAKPPLSGDAVGGLAGLQRAFVSPVGDQGGCCACLPGLEDSGWRFPSVAKVAATQAAVTEGFSMREVESGVYHVEPDPGGSIRWADYSPVGLVGGSWFGSRGVRGGGTGASGGRASGEVVVEPGGLPDAVLEGAVVAAGKELRQYLWQRPLLSFATEMAVGGCVVRADVAWPLGGRGTPGGIDFVFDLGSERWILRSWVVPSVYGWRVGMPLRLSSPDVMAPAVEVGADGSCEVVALPVKVGTRQWLCRFKLPKSRQGVVFPVAVVAVPWAGGVVEMEAV